MIRFDYEDMSDNPGFCRIRRWDDGDTSIKDKFPVKETFEENVPKAEVVKRITELSNKYNP